jgi:hypothetical protein
LNSVEVNCGPLSVLRVVGEPKTENNLLHTLTTVSAVMSIKGSTIKNLENKHETVRKYLQTPEPAAGKGPTRSAPTSCQGPNGSFLGPEGAFHALALCDF